MYLTYSMNIHLHLHHIARFVQATYDGGAQLYEELKATRHYSRSDNFLTISSSTVEPEINSYMVFTIRLSLYVKDVYYEVRTICCC